ncbi:hypothetical protein [Azospirillum canadense]|uniref:hypothetical protein n=1 Tax=Azospirillum canadense TaxID=403962 RepID=UPI002225B958|nr:hypothetical protein [Azospirillum canadense]MCW2239333.1 hypothetical protein [Azospirillum canadense]
MPPMARAPTAGTASRRAALAAATRLLRAELDRGGPADPLVTLWRDWRDAHRALVRLSRRAQRLERGLGGRIGFPRVPVPLEGVGAPPAYATEERDVDRLLGTGPATRALRARLKRDLAAVRTAWTVGAEACGLTAARAGEDAADRRAAALMRTAAATPAQSLAGVVARLAIATEWSAHEPEPDGQPWTFIRTTLADLLVLAGAARTPCEDP